MYGSKAKKKKIGRKVPWITKRGINKSGRNKIKHEGIWVVERLEGFELRHYDGECCKIRSKDKCIYLCRPVDGTWEVVRTVIFAEFNVNWHYNKDVLLKTMEKMVFKWGISNPEEDHPS